MPGLVPGIHVFGFTSKEDVDGRDKPGHDEFCYEHEASSRRKPELLTASAPPRANPAVPFRKIFDCFGGNFSVTVKGSLTPVTQAFRIQTNLFWNATTALDEA